MRVAPVLVRGLFSLSIAAVPALELTAQAAPVASVADDPGVRAAQRLFSAWMEGQVAYRGLPGVVVGVVSDQELVWAQGYGYADLATKRPMTAATTFRIASNSKLFAAIAIMQLREEGKLRLDDPVAQHLPWFRMRPAGADDGPITIEQLLSHSSGMPREATDHWAALDFPTTDEIRRDIADRQAAFPPSTRWKYSNLAFALAGMIVEQVSGMPWADYVQRHIFAPLGMTATSVDRNDPDLAVPYGRRLPDGSRQVLPFVDSRGMAAATGVTSNVEDLAKFLSAQFRRGPRGGREIVSGGSWRELLRVRSVEENWQGGSGLGFDVVRADDRTYVGHAGGYPGNTTQTFIQLDDKVGVIVLTNTNDSYPGDIALELMTTVGAAVAKARRATDTATAAWDPRWERFAGLYRNWSSDQQVVLMNRQLVIITPYARRVEASRVLVPIGNDRFRLMAPTGGAPIGEVVRFEERPGQPMRMHVGDTWADRVSTR